MAAEKFSERDQYWMRHALVLAEQASKQNEVPVGALLVREDEIISEGFNSPITHHDPTAHAEILAMRRGAERIGNYRLPETTLYVTLEPCIMCAGAMVHARIQRLVFGALDPKAGAVMSAARVFDKSFLNHRVQYEGGLLAVECGSLLSNFFKSRR